MRAWLAACVVLTGASSLDALDVPVVRVVWSDPPDAAPFAFPVAAAEGERILREAGVESSWREPAGTTIGPEEVHVVVLPRDRTGRAAMGSTLRRGGSRATWVFVEAVERALGLPGRGARRPRGGEALAIALGRVAVHEVIHALLPGAGHAADGIMRASLGARHLRARRAAIDARTAAALRARLRPGTLVALGAAP